MSLDEDRQITALCWGGVLLISLGSPSHIPRACATPPTPIRGRQSPPSPRPSPWPLTSTPRSHLTHVPRLSVSLAPTFSLPPATLPVSLG